MLCYVLVMTYIEWESCHDMLLWRHTHEYDMIIIVYQYPKAKFGQIQAKYVKTKQEFLF